MGFEMGQVILQSTLLSGKKTIRHNQGNILDLIEDRHRIETTGRALQFIGRSIPVQYDVFRPGFIGCTHRMTPMPGAVKQPTVTLLSESNLHRYEEPHFMKTSFQLPSFFHFCQLGKKRLLNASSHSLLGKFGKVALNSNHSAFAILRISTQFCLGTVNRTERFAKDGSYEGV